MQSIQSAGSGAMTTPGLGEFKKLLETSLVQHAEIVRDLERALANEKTAVVAYERWRNGWLFRKLFKKAFAKLQTDAESATALRKELEEQEPLLRPHTEIEVPENVAMAFHRLRDEFDVMTRAAKIWDIVSFRSTDRVAERTVAGRAIERKPVTFKLDCCEMLEIGEAVPHFGNANGGDLYFFPPFALYYLSPRSFALLEYKELNIEFKRIQFHEEDKVPRDSKVVGQTWAKTNKDGTPDKRFKENYAIPIAEYGQFTITSRSGMNEQWHLSNVDTVNAFAAAWNNFYSAVVTSS